MSLARTALRILLVEALAPTGTPEGGPWPTIARHRVYDSHLVPIEDLSETERRPVVIIYTDDTDAAPRQTNGSAPYRTTVELRFELSVPQLVKDDEDVLDISVPITDPETEASLDLLEAQIVFVLERGPSGALLRKHMPFKVATVSSAPYRTAEDRVRMAMRTLVYKLAEFRTDCYDPAPAADPIGLDRLPDPLKTVAKALPDGSYGLVLATAIAARAPVMPTRVPFGSMGLQFHMAIDPSGEHGAEPDPIGDVTVPQG